MGNGFIKRVSSAIRGMSKGRKAPVNIDNRLQFIASDRALRIAKSNEARAWYIGDPDKLLDFYKKQAISGQSGNLIYSANNYRYFWSVSVVEGGPKKVHSGIPNAIVTSLVNAIGLPTIDIDDDKADALARILKDNDFMCLINQRQMPLTAVEGWGAFKISIDPSISDTPIIQYYEAENVDFETEKGRFVAIRFYDEYVKEEDRYLLVETRRLVSEGLSISYELFKNGRHDVDLMSRYGPDAKPVPLSELYETKDLKDVIIPGYRRLMAKQCRFFLDPDYPDYGRSIFAGKISLFDDLDQCCSQNSQTVRVSTPVEYYPADLLERNKDGDLNMPNIYNRQYINRPVAKGPDGSLDDGKIQTTQPNLNFDQYTQEMKSLLDLILTGILSPATLGIDVAKKDNAEAQREKEKVTIMTRGNIISQEMIILSDLIAQALDAQQIIDEGSISERTEPDDIHVSFPEFANPTFESKLKVLAPAWQMGAISSIQYVDKLWGDSLTEDEKKEEVILLEGLRNDDLMGEMAEFETSSGEKDPVKHAEDER